MFWQHLEADHFRNKTIIKLIVKWKETIKTKIAIFKNKFFLSENCREKNSNES